MNSLIGRYTIGLLTGIIIGVSFPTLMAPWVLFVLPVGIVLVTEITGSQGFGSRWHEYRCTGYLIHSGVAFSAWLGILFGNGMVGKFLVWVGTAIS